MSVQDQVMEIIANQLSVAKEEVTPQASFIDDLGADSLDLVELVMAMEEKFSVDIADEDAEKMKTVQDAINYI
ncbi:MAG: acyl carrier protein, partial [Deltaproteobacteria bacterium]|nr:acyl carrier protein [Deltaproteobacteria bacterium]